MTLGLEFKIDNLNNILIKDTTIYDQPSTGYDGKHFGKYETGSIFILAYNRKNQEPEYTRPIIVDKHTECSNYKISVPKDGWITLYHIILPTKEHLELFSLDVLLKKQITYYLNNGNVYKLSLGVELEVEIEEILEANPEITTANIDCQDYISILNLQECLVSLCRQIFNNLGAFGECFRNDIDIKDLIFKRDIVWMAINVVKYMTKYNMKAEAARIINQLEGCNGICTGDTSQNFSISGCGCSK